MNGRRVDFASFGHGFPPCLDSTQKITSLCLSLAILDFDPHLLSARELKKGGVGVLGGRNSRAGKPIRKGRCFKAAKTSELNLGHSS